MTDQFRYRRKHAAARQLRFHARVQRSYGGTNEIMKEVTARSLGLRKHLSQRALWATLVLQDACLILA